MNSPDILIIGAGAAGLAAANYLQQAGHRVLVLEARNRIGGRVNTDYSWDCPIDLGAFLIHGDQGNPLIDLAKQAQTPLQLFHLDRACLFTQHGMLKPPQFNELRKDYSAWFDSVADKWNATTPDESIVEYFTRVVLADNNQLNKDFLLSRLRFLELYFAGDKENVSAKSWINEESLDGGNYFITQGYSALLKPLADNLEILFNHVVKKIDYSEKEVGVYTENSVFKAKKVIITLPLGVLKKQAVQFNPPLPDEKIQAINTLGFGVLDRIILEFPKAIFSEDLWQIGNTVSEILPIFINYHPLLQRNILFGFGGASKAITLENFSEQEATDYAMEVLRKIFGSDIPQPQRSMLTRWHNDPYSCGSYSYLPVNITIETQNVLAQPVEEKLFFAGEAMHAYIGTVHGAYLSGIAAAKNICELKK